MADNFRVVAEFEDKASEGIKKLDDNINKLGSGANNGGGIKGLAEQVKGLGEQFQGLAQSAQGGIGGIGGMAQAAQGAISSASGLAGAIGGLVAGIAAIGIAAGAAYLGLEKIAEGARSAADDSAEMAEKLGVTMERLEGLKLVADENGTSAEAITRMFDKLSRSMNKLDEDSELVEYAFESLGLNMKDLAGKSNEEIAGIIIKNWEDLGRNAKATDAAMRILGGGFREQIPAIKAMSTSMADYDKRAAEFGAVASENLVKQGGEQEVAISNLGLAWKGLSNEIAEWTGTMLTNVRNWAAGLINDIRKVLAEMRSASDKAARIEAIPQARRNELLKQARQDSDAAGDGTQGDINRRFKALLDAESAPQENLDREFAMRNSEQARIAALQARSNAAKKPTKGDGKDPNADFKAALEDMKRGLAISKETTVEEKTQFEIQQGKYKAFTANQKDQLLNLARQTDMRNAEMKAAEEQKKKAEELKQIQEQAAKAMKSGQEAEEIKLALAEYEVTLVGQNAEERARLLEIKKQELDFQQKSKNLSEEELKIAREKEAEFARRRAEIKDSAKEATTINSIMDQSKAKIQESVTYNLMAAAKLLEAGKITVDDYTKYQDAQLQRLGMNVEKVTDEWTVFWQEAAKNTQGIMADFFFNFMQGKMDNLGDAFKTMLDRMVAQALAAQLGEKLFGANFGKSGSVGGWVGQGLSWLGSAFGGARASGGPVTPGKVYMVGEKGPEPFIPSVPGTILPTGAMSAMGGATTYQINITAMDTQGVRSALEKEMRWLTDGVNKTTRAYNMRVAG